MGTDTATNPIQSLAQAELAIVLKPLDNFLTALQAPNVNTETIVQEFTKLQLAAIQDVPELESVGIGNLAGTIQARLHEIVIKAGPPPKDASAPVLLGDAAAAAADTAAAQ